MVYNKKIIYNVLKDRKEREEVLNREFNKFVIEIDDEKTNELDNILVLINSRDFLEFNKIFNRVYMVIDRGISKESRKKLLNALNNPDGLSLILKDPNIIDSHTKNVDSPIAEVSRILKNDFKISSVFCGINSEVLTNYLDTSLSTNKLHQIVINNFDGVKFRRQNGGFAYTLRLINVGGLNG